MRRYETIIITDPELSAEQREPILKRVEDVISQEKGYLAFIDDWGARKLAYEIKKKPRGYYTRFDFCGSAAAVDEMERFFRIDDRVLKYMTVLLDKTADIEKIKEEIASTQKTVETPAIDTPVETKASQETTDTAESNAPDAPLASAEEPVASTEEPVEAQAETAEEPTTPEEPAEVQTETAEITPPLETAETEEAQTPEPEAGEGEAAPTDIEEEEK